MARMSAKDVALMYNSFTKISSTMLYKKQDIVYNGGDNLGRLAPIGHIIA